MRPPATVSEPFPPRVESGVGALREWGEALEHVTLLRQDETVRLDPDRVHDLFLQLGDRAAEDLVCRGLEEMAARLAHVERCHRRGRTDEMRRTARGLATVADQLGMTLLGRVALSVIACSEAGDGVAMSATLARMLRIGERSLAEFWDGRQA